MKILSIFNPDNILDIENLPASHRISTRAIVLDEQDNIALLHAKNLNYYALPGGGVDEGETMDQAVVRECKEEVGCLVEIIRPLGKVLEVKNDPLRVSEVFGYLVRLVGEKGVPELMPDEIEEGFVVKWLPVTQAKEILADELLRAEEKYKQIPSRGLAFLKEAFPEL